MCHGLFIELIADIKKTNRKGWFFLGIFGPREYSKHANNLLIQLKSKILSQKSYSLTCS